MLARHPAAVSDAADRRHRADAPGRRRRHARAGRLRAVDAVAIRSRWSRTTGSSASTCRAAPAIASACRPNAARGTRPIVWPGDDRRGRRRGAVAAGASPRRRARGGRGERARHRDERPVAGGSTVDQQLDAASAEAGRRCRPTSGSSSCGTRSVDGVTLARSVHASRRLALVVRRDLSAPDAGRHTGASGHRRPRAAGAAGFRGALVRRRHRRGGRDTSRTSVAARTRIACEGPADARSRARGSATRTKALFHTAPGDGRSRAAHAGAARAPCARWWRSCTPHSSGEPGGRGSLRRPDHPGARPTACRRHRRWSGSDRARTSAPDAGAIALHEFVNPQPRDVAATPGDVVCGVADAGAVACGVAGTDGRPSPR